MKKKQTNHVDVSPFFRNKTNPDAQYGFRSSACWNADSNMIAFLPFWLNCVSFSNNLPGWYYEHENPIGSVLEIILEGTLQITHNDKTIMVTPGFAYLLPGGEYNKLCNTGSTPLKKITFFFSGQYAYFILRSIIGDNYLIPIKSIDRIQTYYHNFSRLLESRDEENIPRICGLAMEFIMEVTQMIQKNKMPDALNIVLRILHANLATRIGTAELAASVNLSPYQLLRIFREHFHLTPQQYLCQYRMEKAKSLLLESRSLPLKTIAMQLGYANAFAFSSAFKKYYSVSPKQFRYKRQE